MNILITAGATREYLDPVRFISNPATGALGYACARKAAARGHRVILISGPTGLVPPAGIKTVPVVSALEMKKAVLAHFPRCDALIMTAAVGDWRPARCSRGKIKNKKPWSLRLVPNPDILKSVARVKKPGRIVVGFALESSNIVKNAAAKMEEKRMDFVVADDMSFFGTGKRDSPVYIITRGGKVEDCRGFSKDKLAAEIIKKIEELYDGNGSNRFARRRAPVRIKRTPKSPPEADPPSAEVATR